MTRGGRRNEQGRRNEGDCRRVDFTRSTMLLTFAIGPTNVLVLDIDSKLCRCIRHVSVISTILI